MNNNLLVNNFHLLYNTCIMEYKPNTNNNKNLIVWDSKFEIGIPVIDAQHKMLVNLCNNLYKAVSAAGKEATLERKETVKGALRECADYVQKHFSDEEKLMQLCNYEDFANHKAQHYQFTKKVLEKIQDFENETYASSLEFVKFLYDWILSHIAYTDTLYVNDLKKYMLEKGQAAQS